MEFKEKQDLISSYFSKINILYRKVAKQYDLTYNEMLILHILKQSVPCTQKQIVEQWEIPKQTVNTVIKNLEKENYINFEFSNNNKEKIISLTENGENLIANSIGELVSIEKKIYQKIGEEKCSIVLEALKEFYENLEEETKIKK